MVTLAGKRAARVQTERDKPENGRATLASVNKRLTSSQLAGKNQTCISCCCSTQLHLIESSRCPAEAQAGDAKRILDRERQALRQARQAPNNDAAPQYKDFQTSQQSQGPQASWL